MTIAAQACFLLLHRDTDIYPKLESIVLYPSAYRARKTESLGSGVVLEDDVFLGPSCVLTNVSNPRAEIRRRGLSRLTGQLVPTLHSLAAPVFDSSGAIVAATSGMLWPFTATIT